MADKKRALGRGLTELGLGELLGNSIERKQASSSLIERVPLPKASAASDQPATLPVAKLCACADQPRAEIDAQSLEELAQSIRTEGVIQPIIVRPLKKARGEAAYEIVAGERRWRAAQLAQLTQVPVVVRQLDDKHARVIALIENIQREDLNAMEIAVALGRLTEQFADMTHEDMAKLVGKSRSAVSNFLRLLTLEAPVKRMLENGDLEMGHARALLSLEGALQVQTAKIIIDKALSVRAAEALVRQQQRQNQPTTEKSPERTLVQSLDEQLISYQQQLTEQLKTGVKIKPDARGGSGQLIIKYKDRAKLETVLALLTETELTSV